MLSLAQRLGKGQPDKAENLASSCCAAATHHQKDCGPDPNQCQPGLRRESRSWNKALQPPAGVASEKTD